MTATRMIEGIELPTAGVWQIDPGHAEVAFVGRHFGLTRIRGRFTGIDGAVVIAEDPDKSSVEVVIDMRSVDSGDHSRDEHLRSADFFDVDQYPIATYRSSSVRVEGRSGVIDGALTIKGIARPVRLEVTYLGHATDPWGNERAVFRAAGRIDREDWGLTWNMVLDAGGLLVSKELDLDIELELIQRPG